MRSELVSIGIDIVTGDAIAEELSSILKVLCKRRRHCDEDDCERTERRMFHGFGDPTMLLRWWPCVGLGDFVDKVCHTLLSHIIPMEALPFNEDGKARKAASAPSRVRTVESRQVPKEAFRDRR
jgi:hypothetical protein